MFTEAYLEPSRTSTMELFSLRLSHIFKTYLIWSNCLKFHFSHNSISREKTYNWKLREKKSFVNNGTFFFSKFEITQWNGAINKQKQLPEVFCKKRFSKKFRKILRKTLQALFFNKVVGRPATLLKKRLWHRCFTVNFAKFLRGPLLQNTSGRLLQNKGFLN